MIESVPSVRAAGVIRPLALLIVVVTLLGSLTAFDRWRGEPEVILGVPDAAATVPGPGPRIVTGPPEPGAGAVTIAAVPDEEPTDPADRPRPLVDLPEPPPAAGLAQPDGEPYRPAIAFTSSQPVPDGLVFILVAGSDARPGEELRRSRADSIHLLAVNPATREGTVLGFPRDAWVEIPGHGQGRINNALVLGGPELLASTVRNLTGLPVDYYVLTGFVGLEAMVDELGGVDVPVDRRMNDRFSGARFESGWHDFTGAEALAYSRNRKDVAKGDFTRSEHQGVLILSMLAKMRAEVADDGGVRRWFGVLLRHGELDVPLDQLPILSSLARRIEPNRLDNVVAPGDVGMAGSASVVYLTEDAARLFEDLRADAVIGSPTPPPPEERERKATTTTTSTSTTTAPPTTRGPILGSTTTSTTRPPPSSTTTAPPATTTTTRLAVTIP